MVNAHTDSRTSWPPHPHNASRNVSHTSSNIFYRKYLKKTWKREGGDGGRAILGGRGRGRRVVRLKIEPLVGPVSPAHLVRRAGRTLESVNYPILPRSPPRSLGVFPFTIGNIVFYRKDLGNFIVLTVNVPYRF
eukprot:1193259-Prorocentrum_minimum.AAC.1